MGFLIGSFVFLCLRVPQLGLTSLIVHYNVTLLSFLCFSSKSEEVLRCLGLTSRVPVDKVKRRRVMARVCQNGMVFEMNFKISNPCTFLDFCSAKLVHLRQSPKTEGLWPLAPIVSNRQPCTNTSSTDFFSSPLHLRRFMCSEYG